MKVTITLTDADFQSVHVSVAYEGDLMKSSAAVHMATVALQAMKLDEADAESVVAGGEPPKYCDLLQALRTAIENGRDQLNQKFEAGDAPSRMHLVWDRLERITNRAEGLER